MLGSVYLGKDIRTGKAVALKIERHEGSNSDLLHEYKIYKDIAGCPGVSRVYWYGTEGMFNIMVIDRYELSLDHLVGQAPLDLHTAASFADQMVRISSMLHGPMFSHLLSSIPWNAFILTTIYIVTSSLRIS